MKSLILILVFFTSITYSQEVEKDIKRISKAYAIIESNLKDYTIKQVNADNYSAEGGDAYGYLKEGSLEKINVALYGESGKNFYDFYYENNTLIFALFTRHQYNTPFYFDKKMAEEYGVDEFFDETKTKIIENRYYFKKDELIKWLNHDKKEVRTTSEDLKRQVENLLELSNDLKKEILK